MGVLLIILRRLLNHLKSFIFPKKNLNKKQEILPEMQLELLYSTIKPISFYGAEILGFCKADSFERFYISVLKSILCVKQLTPNCFIYGELGVFPLHNERKLRILDCWFQILNFNEIAIYVKYTMNYYCYVKLSRNKLLG